jgi:hypothetical protein
MAIAIPKLGSWFDLRRFVSGHSFVGDDLLQALDAVLEGNPF